MDTANLLVRRQRCKRDASRAPEATVDLSIDSCSSRALCPSPTAGPAELSIGSERAYSVWLNGKPVHSRPQRNLSRLTETVLQWNCRPAKPSVIAIS